MKKLVQLFVLLCVVNANAQIGGGWDWAFNTGSLGGANIKHMRYNADGSQILFGGTALAAAYFGTTTLTAPAIGTFPGNINFIGKINAATGVPTILKSFTNLPITFDCITTDDAGNFYVGGGLSSTTAVDLGNGVSVSGFLNVVIAKFDPNGNALWAKNYDFGTTGNSLSTVLRLAVSSAGNVFFWADKHGNRPLYKLDSNGNTLWFKNAMGNGAPSSAFFVPPSLSDKFIDNNENVHLFVSAYQSFTFDGVTHLNANPLAIYGYMVLISLNASGTITKTLVCTGTATSFQVNRTSGNLIFEWNGVANVMPSYTLPSNGMVETTSNFNFVKHKNFYSDDNPLYIYNNAVLALPNGKLLIPTGFNKNYSYAAGVDYSYPVDATKAAIAIVETDSDWNMTKFIAGGKAISAGINYLTSFNDTYAMATKFSNHDVLVSAPLALPTTSYGTVNLTGFNAAPDLTTAYPSFSTSEQFRSDTAIVQTKSQNFPMIASTTWLGNTNNWNTASNWSNGVPTVAMKAIFNAPTTNYPTVSTTPTAATLQVNTGVNLTLPTTLVLTGGLKNDGNITINNAGTFQGLGTNEWRGNGTVNFTGTAVNNFYRRAFTNSLVLNTNFATNFDLKIPSITLNNAKLNLNNKKLNITNANPTAISGANATSYIYGGILERNINGAGNYEFPLGTFSFAQTAIINANNLVGTNKIATSFTEGAVTGTIPNTNYNGVPITSALNGGWFTINPNQQPTAGSYDVTLKIQNSTNTLATVGNYTLIKRDNSTSPWAALGNYNLGTVALGIVTVRNSNLTSFSDFAIGRAVSDLSLNTNGFALNKFLLYPNPTTSQINLSFATQLENATIKITSILGQTILEKQNISGNNLSFDVSNLANGMYVVSVNSGGLVSNLKFIKE